MKRFHVHVAVNNLEEGIAFYSKAFGTQPTVQKPDYAITGCGRSESRGAIECDHSTTQAKPIVIPDDALDGCGCLRGLPWQYLRLTRTHP